jgi:CRISPR/Cas system endoribonuclease Cas6 (RAMP superfamily)
MENKFITALEIEIRREEEDFRDLMNDFEFVKELNKELSLKYQDFVDSIPTPEEIDIIILDYKYKEKTLKIDKRLFQLQRFRSAAVLLQKADENNTPMSYEELFKGK